MKVLNGFFNNLSFAEIYEKNLAVSLDFRKRQIFDLINYLVIRRVSSEPKFHSVYQSFLSKLERKFRSFYNWVLKKSTESILLFLKKRIKDLIPSESRILKNLGKWIGKLTLGQENPLCLRLFDVSRFLIKIYDKGIIAQSLSFLSSLLGSLVKSKIFKTGIPWVTEIVRLMTTFLEMVFIKPSTLFDIRILFKKLFPPRFSKSIKFLISFEKKNFVILQSRNFGTYSDVINTLVRKYLGLVFFSNFITFRPGKKIFPLIQSRKHRIEHNLLIFQEVKIDLLKFSTNAAFSLSKPQTNHKILGGGDFKFELILNGKLKSKQKILNTMAFFSLKKSFFFSNKSLYLIPRILGGYDRLVVKIRLFFNLFIKDRSNFQSLLTRLSEIYFLNWWDSFNEINFSLGSFKMLENPQGLKKKFFHELKKNNSKASLLETFPHIFRNLKKKNGLKFPLRYKNHLYGLIVPFSPFFFFYRERLILEKISNQITFFSIFLKF